MNPVSLENCPDGAKYAGLNFFYVALLCFTVIAGGPAAPGSFRVYCHCVRCMTKMGIGEVRKKGRTAGGEREPAREGSSRNCPRGVLQQQVRLQKEPGRFRTGRRVLPAFGHTGSKALLYFDGSLAGIGAGLEELYLAGIFRGHLILQIEKGGVGNIEFHRACSAFKTLAV